MTADNVDVVPENKEFAAPLSDGPLGIMQEACISVRSQAGGCGMCMEVCPENCLKLENGALALDEEKCSECGMCVAVCPSSVFTLRSHSDGLIYTAIETAIEKSPHIELGCRYISSLNSSRGETIVLPCLSMASEAFLVDAALKGAKSIYLSAPCRACKAVEGEKLIKQSAGRSLLILDALGIEVSIRFEVTDSKKGDAAPVGEYSSRRDFIGGIGKSLAKEVIKSDLEASDTGTLSGRLKPIQMPRRRRRLINQILPLRSDGHEFTEKESPFRIVRINGSCSACFACSSYCPTGALTRNERPEAVSIEFTPNKCIKCFGCDTLCPEDAIYYVEKFSVDSVFAATSLSYERGKIVCSSCEMPFFQKKDETLCRTCNKIGKFQKSLFNSLRR